MEKNIPNSGRPYFLGRTDSVRRVGDMPRCLIIAVSMCFFVGMYLIALAVVLVAMIVLKIANGRVLTVTGDTTMANDFKSGALWLAKKK